MMIKWKLELMFGGEIEPVEVVAETAHFVTVKERIFKIEAVIDI
jgi:hypothetical protein